MLATALAAAPPVAAATRTWTGLGGDNNWSTPLNWSASTVPGAGDTVVFNVTSTKSATIDVPVTVAAFQMNAGYSGTITQSSTLTITSSFSQSAGTFLGGGPAIGVTGGTTINSGGTFNGGTSVITLTGALTVNAGGLFTSTSGTLTVTGGVTLAAGAFTNNGGSVVFSTSNATLNLNGAATFNNVQFLSGTKTISAANTMTVLGTLSLTGGAVNTGTVAASGDIVVASTFGGGSGTLLINGAGAQSWTGGGSSSDLPVVNINKAGGTLTMTGTHRTTRNWTWTAGAVVASGSTVMFAAGLTVSGSPTLGSVEMAGGTVTIAAGTTLTATGTTTLTSGTIATGTLAAQGDISAGSGFAGGGGTLLVNGGGPQTWSGAATGSSDLPLVNIDKAAGTLTMTGAFRTTRSWTWTAGGLDALASTVTFTGQTITGSHTLGSVTVAGGTVTIASGTTLTVAGTLTMTSGSVATGTLAAQGDINTASAFAGGSGTLLINGAAAQAWSGTAAGATNLPAVTISKGGGILTMTGTFRTTHSWTWTAGAMAASGSTVTFTGQTISGSHTLGAVTFAGGTVTIAAGTSLTATGTVDLLSGTVNTGTILAQGDVNAEVGFTGGGTATLVIGGGGDQTFTGFQTSTTGALPNVDMNKPSGALTLAGTLRSGRNWTFTSVPAGLAVSGSTVVLTGQTVTGSHTLNALEVRGGTVTIAAGTTLTVTSSLNLLSGSVNTGTLAAQGNIDAQVGFTGGGTGLLLISGTGAQTLTGYHNSTTGAMPNTEINKGSGTLTIAGTVRTARNWTYTAGSIVAAGSTIVFDGTQTISGSHSLDAVEMRGGTITIAAGTTLTAVGNVLLFSGSLGSTGTLAALANVDAQSGFTGGPATLLLGGTGAQSLSQSAIATSSLPVVDIAKPSGTLTMSGTFRTNRDWTYSSGGLAATGTTFQFAGTMTITGSHALDGVEIAGTITIAAGTTVTAGSSVMLTSGSLSIGTLAAQADISAGPGFTGGGTATLLIDGSGAQTLTGFQSTAAGSMPNVNIDKPSGTLALAGTVRTARDWTYSAGGLTAAGSTVVFAGTLTIAGNQMLNDVEFQSGNVTVRSGDTLTVAGLLTLTNGNLNVGTVAALGDVVLQATYDGETGTLLIAGTNDQTLTGFANSTTTDMPLLVIDKPSGTLHLAGTLRMATSSWTWLQGTVDPGSSTVYFGSAVAISGTQTLYNVYLSGGAHTVTNGDILTALGTLTLDSGTIDNGTIAGAGPINQLSTFGGGTGLLAITGGGDQTFTGGATTGAGKLPAVEISKAGGTLTLAGTIRTTNDWTHLAGAVEPGGSTVVFAGTLTIDAGAMAFHDLIVNGGTATLGGDLATGGTLSVAAGKLVFGSHTVFASGDVTVDGALTATTGRLEMNGLSGQTLGGSASIVLYDLTVDDPLGVTMSTNVTVAGTLDLGGPLTFHGQSLTIAHAISGAPGNLDGDATSTLAINGTGSGIVVPSTLSALSNLTLANPNGASLAGPMTVVGTLTVTVGPLDAGAGVLSIGPGGSVARTSGRVVGRLQKWVPIGSGVALTFEIGDATTYAPIGVSFGSVTASGQLTAATTPGEHPAIGSSILDPAHDVNRWWSLTNAGTAFDRMDATFSFKTTDVDPATPAGQLIVVKWDGSWSVPASGGNTATTVTAFGMTSLSEFAIGQPAADLTIAKAGPSVAIAGDPAGIDYTLTVHNAGPADNLAGFTVIDTLPAALTFQSLGSDGRCTAAGQMVTCTNSTGLANGADDRFVIHVTLASGITAGTVVSNTASVTNAGTHDPDASNDVSTTTAVVAVVPPAPTPSPTASLPNTGLTGPNGSSGELLPWVASIAALAIVLMGLAVLGVRGSRLRS